jgi:prophage DNA circulation protein
MYNSTQLKVFNFFLFKVDQKHSPEMRILLRLSSNHYTNQSKFENAFYTAMSVDETVNILLKSIKTVNDNIRYLGDELIKNQNSLQHLSQECSLMKTDFRQQSKSNHDMIEQKFLAIRQSMEDLHYATHDGSFIWKIENFAKTFGE